MDFNWVIQHKEIDGGSSANYWDTVKRRDHQHPEQVSFECVCFVLGLNSQRIRKRLQTWETEAGGNPTVDSN